MTNKKTNKNNPSASAGIVLGREVLEIPGTVKSLGDDIIISDNTMKRHMIFVGEPIVDKSSAVENMVYQHSENQGGSLFIDSRMDLDAITRSEKQAAAAGRSADLIIIEPRGTDTDSLNNFANQVRLLDIYDCITSNKIVHIMLPSFESSTKWYRALCRDILASLTAAVSTLSRLPAERKLKSTFLVVFDEFAVYADESVKLLWQQSRSANVALCAAFRSFATLYSLPEDFANTVICNSITKVYYSQRDRESVRLAAAIMGVPASNRPLYAAVADLFKDIPRGECLVQTVNNVYRVRQSSLPGFRP